jgi:hypothetical protein
MPDLSVPLLLPLQYLAALSAPRAVALSEPLFAAVLIAAIGFAVFQLKGCRLAASAAMSSAVLLMLSPLIGGANGLARAELGVTFVILAVGLQPRFRLEALLSAAIGIAVGFAPGHFAASCHVLIPYASCVLLGAGIADFRIRLSEGFRRLATAALIVCLAVAGSAFLNSPALEGPVQYEEAAQIAQGLANEQPRNAWALVATTQELPYVYGSGWHVEIASFVSDADIRQVALPSYRFPFPVRDVYFLVERQPLVPYSSAASDQPPLQVRLSPTPSAAYGTPLERASLEFKLAELLSVYRLHHDDLDTVHQSAQLVVLRAPGSLPERR